MSTFLQLCQAVARESGTFPNVGDPATVAGATGRVARLIYWVNDAYGEIQREQFHWRWLQSEVTGNMVAGITTYDGASMGVTERFGEWMLFPDGEKCEVSAWDPDIGQSDEGFLPYMEWVSFRREYRTGANAAKTGKPAVCSLSPDGDLAVYPAPDKAYKLRCPYRKSAQQLTEDNHIPEMPADFHDAIKWKGLVYLGMFDEATQQKSEWQSKYGRVMGHLRNRQLPQTTMGGAALA